MNWTSPFPILGLLGGIFHYYSTFNANSGEPDQMLGFAASDLVLYCLTMSNKKDARLIGVKHPLGAQKKCLICFGLEIRISNLTLHLSEVNT